MSWKKFYWVKFFRNKTMQLHSIFSFIARFFYKVFFLWDHATVRGILISMCLCFSYIFQTLHFSSARPFVPCHKMYQYLSRNNNIWKPISNLYNNPLKSSSEGQNKKMQYSPLIMGNDGGMTVGDIN